MRVASKFGGRIRRGGRPRRDIPLAFPGELLTQREAAEYLRIPGGTLQYWRSKRARRGPRFIKLHSHLVLYRLSDLETFLRRRTVDPAGRGNRG